MTSDLAFNYDSPDHYARVEAGPQGLRLSEPDSEIELPWSSVVSVQRVRRFPGRFEIALHMADGPTLRPAAMRRLRRRDAVRVETAWSIYGAQGAAAMWGRPAVGGLGHTAAA